MNVGFLVNPSLTVPLQDLADDLSSELSGNFRSIVLGLLMLAPVYDAYELRNAIKVRDSHLLFYMYSTFFDKSHKKTKTNNKAKSKHEIAYSLFLCVIDLYCPKIVKNTSLSTGCIMASSAVL